MQKSFLIWLCVSSLFLSGCNTLQELGEAVPDALGETPLMYKPTIQQGNVVTQEMVDKLKPGMNRRQVTYILGTPLLVDAFHQDRWDYVYTKEVGGGAGNKTHISLYFEDDILVRIGGDFRPQPKEDPLAGAEETVFTVPDYTKKEKGFFSRTLETIGIDTDEEESTPSAAGMGDDSQLPDIDKESSGDLPETVAEAQAESSQMAEDADDDEEQEAEQSEEEEKGFFDRALDVIGL
jgi:outer membrane protein assembly factor BamE